MSDQDVFPQGSFCWVELGTTDAPAAGTFYKDLFGLAANEIDMGEMGTYTLLQLDGHDIAGMYALSDEQREQGVPPHWLSYVHVEDTDESAKRATTLGATILMGPLDVPNVGKMAIVQDPGQAVFALFQPGEQKGARPMDNKPGMFCWNELATKDPKGAVSFYTELFGWTADTSDPQYTMWMNDGRLAGGMLEISEAMGDVPANWMVYFAVDDCDGVSEKAKSSGAHEIVPPTNIDDIGRFSALVDPQGAVFSIIKLESPESNS